MQYRRIHDLGPADSLSRAPLAQSDLPRNPRKRKLDTASHQSCSGQSVSASHVWETYNEEEIHLFRRVHIKMKKPVEWSQRNKNQHIVIGPFAYPSATVKFMNVGPFEVVNQKAAVVHCNKPFDGAFCYFEIGVVYYVDADYKEHV